MRYILALFILASCTTSREISVEASNNDSKALYLQSEVDSLLSERKSFYEAEIERVKNEGVIVRVESNDTCNVPPKLYRISVGGDSVLVYGVVKSYEYKKKASESVSFQSKQNVSEKTESVLNRTEIALESNSQSKVEYKEIIKEPSVLSLIWKYGYWLLIAFVLGYLVKWLN